jgi:hypothetical protein
MLQVSPSFLDMPEAKEAMRKKNGKNAVILGVDLTKIGLVSLGIEFVECRAKR